MRPEPGFKSIAIEAAAAPTRAKPSNYPEPFFSLISNPEDMVELTRGSDKIIAVPLFASHWVNPDFFPAPPRQSR